MAGLTPDQRLDGASLARQQYQTIAWLRWRIFKNSMRRKNAVGELAVRILSYPVVALMILGPAIVAGIGSWYLVSHGMDSYLAIPLWIIFALWQFIGVSTSTTAPAFDLSTLARFPLPYRDYLLIRLSFGLLDIPTLAGTACLLAMCIGIGLASPALIPWTIPTLFIYATANILFSRMVYAWFERWLARRRTRELLTVFILVFSLAIQFGSQFLQRLNLSQLHPESANPSNKVWINKSTQVLLEISNLLPPGLTASSLARHRTGLEASAVTSLAGLLIYTLAFLYLLHVRLKAQYLGENLSEAPANALSKPGLVSRSIAPSQFQNASNVVTTNDNGLLSPAVRACFTREVRYLLRSGPKLYALIMPVFMLLLFSFRTAGLEHTGYIKSNSGSFLFPYGCAYMQLILVSMLYNSFGSDGSGIQFYFLAPVRFRDVMLAKNLLVALILAIELLLMYVVSSFISTPTALPLTAATVAWTLFTFLLNLTLGNIRSLVSPMVVEAGKIRRQNMSGISSLISLGIVVFSVSLGVAAQLLATFLGFSYWIAVLAFLVLAALTFAFYLRVLSNLDKLANNHREELILELSKA